MRTKETERARLREYYLANREKALQRAKEWSKNNPGKRKLIMAKWNSDPANHEKRKTWSREFQRTLRAENPGAVKQRQARWYAKNYKTNYMKRCQDPMFRIVQNLRNRVYKTVTRGHKSAKTLELLGCSPAQFRLWLVQQFKAGMTWENYGEAWHVDHIRPCVSFDLSTPAQQRECFHYTNLQPLFALDNLRKGALV